MSVLITGGEGDIAKSIASVLRNKKYAVFTPGRYDLDVSCPISIQHYIKHIQPEILINCAGYINPNKLECSDATDFIKHFEVNVFGSFLCTKEALKYKCKKVINIGSTASFESKSGWGAYCASKAALMSLTETFASESVLCFGLHPGRTQTKMRKKLFPEEDPNTLITPDRIAAFVLDILQDKFENGANILVLKDKHFVFSKRVCPR